LQIFLVNAAAGEVEALQFTDRRRSFRSFGIAEMPLSQHYREREKLERVLAVLSAAGLPD
jgi:hypothetical protein